MRYLFAFDQEKLCRSLAKELESAGIPCCVRFAEYYPDGTQGPELWVCDDKDYERGREWLEGRMSER